jgi:hypothetical protein
MAAENCLRNMLESAREGDCAAYLSAFGGPLRQRLEHEIQERGSPAFAADLQRAALARKGHALYAPEADGADAFVIILESVFPDRNERQAYRLERASGNWLIAAIEPARGNVPPAKYGESADEQAPQDVPVAPDESGQP